MPATVILSGSEIDALQKAGVGGVTGNAFTYSLTDTLSILSKVKNSDAKDSLMRRLASVASQLGQPHVMFKETVQEPTRIDESPVPASSEPVTADQTKPEPVEVPSEPLEPEPPKEASGEVLYKGY